ncbi:MAG: hypothetical protein Kow0042_14790 [Calditrichia bacterium]
MFLYIPKYHHYSGDNNVKKLNHFVKMIKPGLELKTGITSFEFSEIVIKGSWGIRMMTIGENETAYISIIIV